MLAPSLSRSAVRAERSETTTQTRLIDPTASSPGGSVQCTVIEIREEVDRISGRLRRSCRAKLLGQAATGIALSTAPAASRDAERAKLHDAARKTLTQKSRSTENRNTVPTMDTSSQPAITRCSCSTGRETVSVRSCDRATCTVPRTGRKCFCQKSSVNRN